MISCKKINDSPLLSDNVTKNTVTTGGVFSRQQGKVSTLTNQDLLKLVLSGEGGRFKIDTTCDECPVDSSGYIEFPAYKPPVNSGGMLSFSSMSDYNSFIIASGLMEDLWNYKGNDYEDTPQEIYHLGEESLNALDSSLGFKSLRSQYELNEFINYDWIDSADLYVDDEDYQIVFNRNHEVELGNKYFKAISNNIIAVVNNSNIAALEQLRIYDIFTNNVDLQFFNEETGEYEKPPTINITSQTARDCSDYKPLSHVSVLTPFSSTANQWTVQLRTSVYYPVDLPDYPGSYVSILANYTVDWGDGTTSTFIAPFISGHTSLIHVYNQNLPPGGSVQKTINVSCQFIYPQNSSSRLDKLINECPQLINSPFFNSSATFMLTNPATEDCMKKNIKRKFYGAQLSWGGNTYRLYCKLKQKSDPFIGFSHVTSTVTFEKQKGNSWKKVKPVNSLILKLRGNIYTENTCSNLYGTMDNAKSTSKKPKLKIRESRVTSQFESRRSLPLAINADFIWTYNSGPSSIGEFNKVLKP